MPALTPAQRALFESDFREAVEQGKLATVDRAEVLEVFSRHAEFREKILGGDTAGLLVHWVHGARAEDVRTFSRSAAGETVAMARATGVYDREPPDLDDDGRQLYSRAVDEMQNDETLDFDAAFARVAPEASLGVRGPGAIPDSAFSDNTTPTLEEHQTYRQFSRVHGIDYMDAMQLAQYSEKIASLEADDGASDVAWLDARPRATPAKPWSDDDYETDKRRASAHNLDFGFDDPQHGRMVWEAATSEGTDPVAEAFTARRDAELKTARAEHEGFLFHAQARAGEQRQQMIATALDERARRRLA